ncbi:MAG: OmpA family protein [Pseudomonadota bacterium]
MARFLKTFLWALTLATWGLPVSAADPCAISASDKPAWCPSDARIAALAPELRENNVFFPRGGSALDASATAQIALLAKVLNTEVMAGTCLRLVGHSDSSGAASTNAALSERRAEAVRKAIAAELGSSAPPMETAGMGEDAHLSELPTTHVAQRRVTLWAKSCDS